MFLSFITLSCVFFGLSIYLNILIEIKNVLLSKCTYLLLDNNNM